MPKITRFKRARTSGHVVLDQYCQLLRVFGYEAIILTKILTESTLLKKLQYYRLYSLISKNIIERTEKAADFFTNYW